MTQKLKSKEYLFIFPHSLKFYFMSELVNRHRGLCLSCSTIIIQQNAQPGKVNRFITMPKKVKATVNEQEQAIKLGLHIFANISKFKTKVFKTRAKSERLKKKKKLVRASAISSSVSCEIREAPLISLELAIKICYRVYSLNFYLVKYKMGFKKKYLLHL